MASQPDTETTIDADDVSRFDSQAGQWWDTNGPMKPLHLFTPVRLDYILTAARRTGLTNNQTAHNLSLNGCKALDVGCGGTVFSRALMPVGGRNYSY